MPVVEVVDTVEVVGVLTPVPGLVAGIAGIRSCQ